MVRRDLLRDAFERGKYRDVILPLTVLWRIDCVLEPTEDAVLKRNAELKELGLENRYAQLRRASGYAFGRLFEDYLRAKFGGDARTGS